MPMVIVYGIGSLIYFKVATAAFMDKGMNFVMATLAGVGMFVVAYCLGFVTATALGKMSVRSLSGSVSTFAIARNFFVPALVGWVALCVWLFVISVGFDQSFYKSLFGRWSHEQRVAFGIISAIPILLCCALSVWVVANAVRQRSEWTDL